MTNRLVSVDDGLHLPAAVQAQLTDDVIATTEFAAVAASAAASAASAALSASLVGAPADTAVAAIVGNPASATSTTLSATYATVFTPEKYGAVGNGTTDDTAAVNAAIAGAAVAGGKVRLQAKTYLCLGALTVPNSGGSALTQKPVKITGVGATNNGYWILNPVNGGSVLDLRYTGADTLHPAKFDTRGAGTLEISGVTFLSGGTDNFPFFQTTNTTVKIHDNAFVGNAANSGQTCVQDAVILGGTNLSAAWGAADQPFQGYGTVVSDNYFARVRQCVFVRSYANSVIVTGNTVSSTCGAADGTTAAIHVLGDTGTYYTEGIMVHDNIIEVVAYPYAILIDNAHKCVIGPDGIWDGPAGVSLGGVYVGTGAQQNLFVEGVNGSAGAFVVEATPGNNTIMWTHQVGGYSITADQLRVGKAANALTMGPLGTADLYIDAMNGSSGTNVPIHIRPKGNGSVTIDGHSSTKGSTPTAAAENGSTVPAITAGSTDNGGNVTVTTAASVAADVAVVRINYAGAWNASIAPLAIVITPLNAASAGAQAWVIEHTVYWIRIALHVPPAAATALAFSYLVLGAY